MKVKRLATLAGEPVGRYLHFLTPNSSDYVRVNRHRPCPICEKPDWCTVLVDGTATFCMRVENDTGRRARNGAWIHRFDSPNKAHVPRRRRNTEATCQRAGSSKLDSTYRALLDVLDLAPADRQQLCERGMSNEETTGHQYRTLPANNRRDIAESVAGIVGDLIGVPGFYRCGTRPDSPWSVDGRPGLLIPVRQPDPADQSDRIIAFQIRPYDQQAGRKYVWLSSVGRPEGTSPGSPAHVAIPRTVTDNCIWITEGPLKADIVSTRISAVVIGTPGVSTWKGSGVVDLMRRLDSRRRHSVVLAFDQDAKEETRRHVEPHRNELAAALRASGYVVELASW